MRTENKSIGWGGLLVALLVLCLPLTAAADDRDMLGDTAKGAVIGGIAGDAGKGAAAGAVGGALFGGMEQKPGKDTTPMGDATRGAAKGAVIGAVAGDAGKGAAAGAIGGALVGGMRRRQ